MGRAAQPVAVAGEPPLRDEEDEARHGDRRRASGRRRSGAAGARAPPGCGAPPSQGREAGPSALPPAAAALMLGSMVHALLRRLLAPDPGTLPPPDESLALAALLVRVGRADGAYSAAEMSRIDAVLRARFGARPLRGGAAALRGRGGWRRRRPTPCASPARSRTRCPTRTRVGLVEAMWDVALADGRRDAEEDAVMRLVAPMLGVEDADSGLARQRVEARAGGRR